MGARITGLWAVFLLAAAQPAVAVDVLGVRVWAGPDRTRVVMDLSEPVPHDVFMLARPDRVVVDLLDASLAPQVEEPDGQGLVRRIRTGRRDNDALRVVLDLHEATGRPRSFLLPPNDVYGHRLVVDLMAAEAAVERKVVAVAPARARDVLVAIDPGHGGEDPGAIGRRGTYEKQVVMQIARRLASLVNAERGMRALLTRDGDYGLSLRSRVDKAREHRADFFISIHADAFHDRRAYGSSVYALSQRGATSEAARWLAERENTADLIGGISLEDKDEVLASVLLDLSQTAAISASLRAGGEIIEGLGRTGRVRRQEVQQANFMVLKSPDIPSVLVETAFISNPEEERKLRDPAHQQALALALMSGIRRYFAENAPPGTLLAEDRSGTGVRTAAIVPPMRHVINRGDTLSTIAARYNVSLSRLRQHNGLRSDVIRVGQVLQIPATR